VQVARELGKRIARVGDGVAVAIDSVAIERTRIATATGSAATSAFVARHGSTSSPIRSPSRSPSIVDASQPNANSNTATRTTAS